MLSLYSLILSMNAIYLPHRYFQNLLKIDRKQLHLTSNYRQQYYDIFSQMDTPQGIAIA
jgi:hypothetical protein